MAPLTSHSLISALNEVAPSEHAAHVDDFADNPIADIRVERGGAVEHVAHVGDYADIPITTKIVDRGRAPEHPAGIGDRRQVGAAGITEDGEVGGAVETVLHTRPHLVAPPTDVADFGSVGAGVVEVDLREVAGDGDDIVVGIGVGMRGVAGIGGGIGAVVSPIHHVIVGEVAVGRDDDRFAVSGGAPDGDEPP